MKSSEVQREEAAGWRIELLGGLRVRRGGRTIAHFGTQKAGALLGFLAFEGGREHSREKLAEMLSTLR